MAELSDIDLDLERRSFRAVVETGQERASMC
jgi:hypothetical protein